MNMGSLDRCSKGGLELCEPSSPSPGKESWENEARTDPEWRHNSNSQISEVVSFRETLNVFRDVSGCLKRQWVPYSSMKVFARFLVKVSMN